MLDRGCQVLLRDGCPLHYFVDGKPGAPWVVMTHGFCMDHRLFSAQVAALRPHYRVLLWDVRGHGRSRPMGRDFTVRQAASDLIALLDANGIEQAVLVGHSMGAYISQQVHFEQPGRVRAMVMISSTCLTSRQPWVLRKGGPLTVHALRLWPSRWTPRHMGLIAGVRRDVRRYAEQASAVMHPSDRVRVWKGVLGGYHYEPSHRIGCPLLLLDGQLDYIVGFGLIKLLARSWAQREPNCRREVIPLAGHNANQDNPSFTNEALRRFLAMHAPSSGQLDDAAHVGALGVEPRRKIG